LDKKEQSQAPLYPRYPNTTAVGAIFVCVRFLYLFNAARLVGWFSALSRPLRLFFLLAVLAALLVAGGRRRAVGVGGEGVRNGHHVVLVGAAVAGAGGARVQSRGLKKRKENRQRKTKIRRAASV